MILIRILLLGCLQVVSPVLAVRQSGETLAGYAASKEPNDRRAAFNPPRRGIIRNAALHRLCR